MEDQEIVDELEEESKFVKIFKKLYLIVMALVLVTLLLVNTNTGYHLISFFSGRIVSSNINKDYSFDLKFGGKIFFSETVWNALSTVYQNNKKHEFKICLTGFKEDNNYYVKGIYMPKIYNQEVFSVTSQMCSKETIISLHSHPPFRCIFSEQDINSYNQFFRINPDAIIGLMCGETRLSFYGY